MIRHQWGVANANFATRSGLHCYYAVGQILTLQSVWGDERQFSSKAIRVFKKIRAQLEVSIDRGARRE